MKKLLESFNGIRVIGLVIVLVLWSFNVFAQEGETPKKISVSPFSGQFMVSTNFKAGCINMIGAGIRYTKNDWVIGVSLYPSLIFKKYELSDPTDTPKPFVRPGFAVGPLIQYKKVIIGFPSFYQDDAWHFTGGIGVKLGK